jgi:Ni2+-binding GTPase involved in maturation of urease and hydrogenase
MTVIIVGGPPSAGKTRVIHKALDTNTFDSPVGVAKLDCVEGGDEKQWQARGVPVRSILAGDLCPDHMLMEQFPALLAWAEELALGTIVIETAGLCGRCAPYLHQALALAVLDATAGIAAPRKFGPLLEDADLVVMTRGDLVSQAEREAFAANVRAINPRARRIWLDGRTGEGSQSMAMALREALVQIRCRTGSEGSPALCGPRTPLPQLYCSYCLGRDQVGIAVL